MSLLNAVIYSVKTVSKRIFYSHSIIQGRITADAEEQSCPCPLCRSPIKLSELYPGSWLSTNANLDQDTKQLFDKTVEKNTTSTELKDIVFALHPSGDFNEWITSSKVKAMIEILKTVRKRDRYSKTVIFSQWTSMIDIIGVALSMDRFQYVRYDGSMSALERVEAVDSFFQDKNKTIALISLKAGGVGLNLTCATQVILMDLWWNPKVEVLFC
jgi:SNF2 family DNA or RNA helicase